LIRWLLDTNVIEELGRSAGSAVVKAWANAQPEDRMFLSILTFGEYEKGIHKLAVDDPRRERFGAARDALRQRFGRRVLPVSDGVVLRWGAISGRVRRETGHPPPVIDTLLAATALEHDLYLATRNTGDVAHSGAAVFKPWTDEPANYRLA
jgi:predicted nucleic acid-binding protein